MRGVLAFCGMMIVVFGMWAIVIYVAAKIARMAWGG